MYNASLAIFSRLTQNPPNAKRLRGLYYLIIYMYILFVKFVQQTDGPENLFDAAKESRIYDITIESFIDNYTDNLKKMRDCQGLKIKA